MLVFGTFDPLHDGHRDLFRQAKAWGDHLLVVVTSDAVVQAAKNRQPFQLARVRQQAVAQEPLVDEVRRGEEQVNSHRLLGQLDFDILALGYDQSPDEATVRQWLARHDKADRLVVRLKPYRPEQFKSSLFRPA